MRRCESSLAISGCWCVAWRRDSLSDDVMLVEKKQVGFEVKAESPVHHSSAPLEKAKTVGVQNKIEVVTARLISDDTTVVNNINIIGSEVMIRQDGPVAAAVTDVGDIGAVIRQRNGGSAAGVRDDGVGIRQVTRQHNDHVAARVNDPECDPRTADSNPSAWIMVVQMELIVGLWHSV